MLNNNRRRHGKSAANTEQQEITNKLELIKKNKTRNGQGKWKLIPSEELGRPAKPTTATKNKTKLTNRTHRNEISDGIMDYVGWTKRLWSSAVYACAWFQIAKPYCSVSHVRAQERDLRVRNISRIVWVTGGLHGEPDTTHFFGLDCRPLVIAVAIVFFFCQRCRLSSSWSLLSLSLDRI